MKKIPTLFERQFEEHKVVYINPVVDPSLQWVLDGKGIATVKYDGSCCAIYRGELYKRYDAKAGKLIPPDAIPCQDAPDSITGHFPCFVPCKQEEPADRHFFNAYEHSMLNGIINRELVLRSIEKPITFEAIGPKFRNNPYKLQHNYLLEHGKDIIEDCPRDFEGIKKFLERHMIEGIVFWRDDEPRCKIKRKDFGLPWEGGKSVFLNERGIV